MEGGWEEYRLLHQYERDFQKDAKYLLVITLIIIGLLGAGSAFEIVHVDIERNVIVSTSTNSPTSVVTERENDKLSVYAFYRCMYHGQVKNGTAIVPNNETGTQKCDLAVYGSQTCEFEKALMYAAAVTVAVSFLACIFVLIGSLRTVCTKKPNVRCLWFSTIFVVIASACACASIVTM